MNSRMLPAPGAWRLRLALLLGCYSILVAPASAVVISANLDPTKFGNLDQNNTTTAGCGCGPTSATNSFVFLQKMYPNVYPNNVLVPYAGASPTQAEQAAVANILGGATYMDAGAGTYIEDFVYGKQKYLESKAPGKTKYHAQINFAWRPGAPTTSMIPKPSFVQDNTKPTLSFLSSEIAAGEDVEVFLSNSAGGAHYITLTGISYDTATNAGTIKYIDPLGGGAGTKNIVGLNGGFIELSYQLSGANTLIAHAIAESPAPEPATIVMAAIAFACLLRVRRQATAP